MTAGGKAFLLSAYKLRQEGICVIVIKMMVQFINLLNISQTAQLLVVR